MEKKILYPAPGKKVPIPGKRGYLPEDGAEVEIDTYWYRRLTDEDVFDKKPEHPVETSTEAGEPKKKKLWGGA